MNLILKYTINKIIEQTSNIPYINSGGCCHYAKILAKELESRNIKYKVGLFNNSKNENKTLVKYLKETPKKELMGTFVLDMYAPSHIVIKIDKTYIDGMEVTKHPYFNGRDFSTTKDLKVKHLITLSNGTDWNDLFDRKKYHPIISKIIKEQFKIYDKLIKNAK